MNNDVRDEVLAYFATKGTVPGNTTEEKLECRYLDCGLLDSFGIMDMIGHLEQKFGIRFEAEQLQAPEFLTIGGLARMVADLAAKPRP